jgi:hypothetical protein
MFDTSTNMHDVEKSLLTELCPTDMHETNQDRVSYNHIYTSWMPVCCHSF